MEKIKLGTSDGATENVKRITELFPQVVTEIESADGEIERTIDFDALRDLLGDVAEGQRERYQFTWPGKREAKAEARRPIYKTMIPEPDKSKDWDTTENLYIEGDNLDALKILKETYAGKVKLIYIDPPYNTGNDFVYDDDFSKLKDEYNTESGDYDGNGGRLVQNLESNGRFHSKWCSMMFPRLLLARDLLTADGTMFVSIDDHELINLQKMVETVFGSDNIASIVTVVVKPEGRRYGLIAKTHEYLLVVTKNYMSASLNEVDTEGASFGYFDAEGGFNLQGLRNRNVRAFNSENRPNLRYPFWVNTSVPDENNMYEVSVDEKVGWDEVWASTVDGLKSVWRWGKDKARTEAGNLIAYRGPDGNIRVFQKVRKLTQSPKSLWNKKEFQSNVGTKEVANLLGKGVFDFPKPVGLLKEIVQIATDEEDLIVDFFSGSATMAEAVMRKNVEDNGRRRFILVQFPEETPAPWGNLCNVGEERIRCTGVKIAAEIDEANRQLELGAKPKTYPDLGFRVLRIDSSNFKDFYLTPGETSQESLFDFADNVKEGRSDLDLLFEVLPKLGIPYSAKIEERMLAGKKVFFVDGDKLAACFDANVGSDTIEEMAKAKPWYAVIRDSSMADDATHANYEELFRTYSPDTVPQVI